MVDRDIESMDRLDVATKMVMVIDHDTNKH